MANDFSGDSNCISVWRFEENALLVDSKGTNTLTACYTPDNDTVVFKEGACSAKLVVADGRECFYRPDADLSAGFPLKSGDTVKKISVCGWFRFNTLVNNGGPFGKADTGNGTISVRPLYTALNGRWYSAIGWGAGGTTEVLYQAPEPGPAAVTGRWYHFGFTFDDSDKSWKLVIWDDTASAKAVNVSGYSTNNIFVGGASIRLGLSYSFAELPPAYTMDGNIDEIVVFNDILSFSQIDGIRMGIYPHTPNESAFWPVIFGMLEQQKKGE